MSDSLLFIIFYSLVGMLAVYVTYSAFQWGKVGKGGLSWLFLAGLTAAFSGWCLTLSIASAPPALPLLVQNFLDQHLTAPVLVLLWLGSFCLIFFGRRFFLQPHITSLAMLGVLLFLGLSLENPAFRAKALLPDNIAVMITFGLFLFFLWAGLGQAYWNDERRAKGLVVMEKRYRGRVYTWPDLVYTELIVAVLISAVLLFWSLLVPAPLEPPADPSITPSITKAPWYFVGLQELLVYTGEWIAGFTLPVLIFLSLLALPYLDQRKGEGRGVVASGYYTVAERKLGIFAFLFGLWGIWMLLIFMGTFFRGPHWNWVGLFTSPEALPVMVVEKVNFSPVVWEVFSVAIPDSPLLRELPGILLLVGYLVLLTFLLGKFPLRHFRQAVTPRKFYLVTTLLLLMFLIPTKIICYWWFDLGYFVSLPEYFCSV